MNAIDTSSLSPRVIEDFFMSSMDAMPSARLAYAALEKVYVKEIVLPSGKVRAQYNPARAVSSSAKVDAASINARPCFLCVPNRPDAQPALDLGAYELLVNPFPVFCRHFTIPAKEHTPQRIMLRIADMVSLALSMSGYTVFYNGPRCGASAPDHMHFQAGPSEAFSLPSVYDADVIVADVCGWSILLHEGVVPMLIIRAHDSDTVSDVFMKVCSAMTSVCGCEDEPMMNVLCRSMDGEIFVYIIPRSAHRPDFYGTGETQMLMSPAAVDLGGLFILPRKIDYDRFDGAVVADTVRQVCPDADTLKLIKDFLR